MGSGRPVVITSVVLAVGMGVNGLSTFPANQAFGILGAGMVDPRVLSGCGIDPKIYSGFAFGLGIDRVAMIRYGIPNIRMLFDNDERLLRQVKI